MITTCRDALAVEPTEDAIPEQFVGITMPSAAANPGARRRIDTIVEQ